jgi:hypothetical protein
LFHGIRSAKVKVLVVERLKGALGGGQFLRATKRRWTVQQINPSTIQLHHLFNRVANASL